MVDVVDIVNGVVAGRTFQEFSSETTQLITDIKTQLSNTSAVVCVTKSFENGDLCVDVVMDGVKTSVKIGSSKL